jgi:hypothetical protein
MAKYTSIGLKAFSEYLGVSEGLLIWVYRNHSVIKGLYLPENISLPGKKHRFRMEEVIEFKRSLLLHGDIKIILTTL